EIGIEADDVLEVARISDRVGRRRRVNGDLDLLADEVGIGRRGPLGLTLGERGRRERRHHDTDQGGSDHPASPLHGHLLYGGSGANESSEPLGSGDASREREREALWRAPSGGSLTPA